MYLSEEEKMLSSQAECQTDTMSSQGILIGAVLFLLCTLSTTLAHSVTIHNKDLSIPLKNLQLLGLITLSPIYCSNTSYY